MNALNMKFRGLNKLQKCSHTSMLSIKTGVGNLFFYWGPLTHRKNQLQATHSSAVGHGGLGLPPAAGEPAQRFRDSLRFWVGATNEGYRREGSGLGPRGLESGSGQGRAGAGGWGEGAGSGRVLGCRSGF